MCLFLWAFTRPEMLVWCSIEEFKNDLGLRSRVLTRRRHVVSVMSVLCQNYFSQDENLGNTRTVLRLFSLCQSATLLLSGNVRVKLVQRDLCYGESAVHRVKCRGILVGAPQDCYLCLGGDLILRG